MVQLKYFGDSRDYFKYDVISAIFKHSSLCHYVFVPMLTEHRQDKEGKRLPTNRGDKSDELLEFIKSCNHKSLKHWERWLGRHVQSYKTIEPIDDTFFSDGDRDAYWSTFRPMLSQKDALVFVDPDTGLETGKPGYLRKMGREKYILNGELKFLIQEIDRSSALMLYQHLPYNKHTHTVSVERKLAQVRRADSSVHTCAYREDDLAFLFVSKQRRLHDQVQDVLSRYHAHSLHQYKSLHA